MRYKSIIPIWLTLVLVELQCSSTFAHDLNHERVKRQANRRGGGQLRPDDGYRIRNDEEGPSGEFRGMPGRKSDYRGQPDFDDDLRNQKNHMNTANRFGEAQNFEGEINSFQNQPSDVNFVHSQGSAVGPDRQQPARRPQNEDFYSNASPSGERGPAASSSVYGNASPGRQPDRPSSHQGGGAPGHQGGGPPGRQGGGAPGHQGGGPPGRQGGGPPGHQGGGPPGHQGGGPPGHQGGGPPGHQGGGPPGHQGGGPPGHQGGGSPGHQGGGSPGHPGGGSPGHQGGSPGFQGGSPGFQGGSSGFQGGSSGHQDGVNRPGQEYSEGKRKPTLQTNPGHSGGNRQPVDNFGDEEFSSNRRPMQPVYTSDARPIGQQNSYRPPNDLNNGNKGHRPLDEEFGNDRVSGHQTGAGNYRPIERPIDNGNNQNIRDDNFGNGGSYSTQRPVGSNDRGQQTGGRPLNQDFSNNNNNNFDIDTISFPDRNNGPTSTDTANNRPRCRSSEFTCGNRECVPNSARCNGRRECRDGSDELNCRREDVTPSNEIHATTSSSPSLTTAESTGSGCLLPEYPVGGVYELGGCTAPCRLQPGSSVPRNSILTFRCHDGYTLKGNTISFCHEDEWYEPPSCVRSCSPLNSTSVDITCTYQGETVSCESAIAPGTKATLACKHSYKLPLASDPAYRELTCLAEGVWDRTLFRCLPECGTAVAHGNTLIVNGFTAKLGVFPWHVGVYQRDSYGFFEQICAGSLISSNLVISAAHCFYDDTTNEVMDSSNYAVAAGKHYREYDRKEKYVQKSLVKKIEVADRYYGASGNFAEDIAIVYLESPFTLTTLVRPICMDWDNTYEREQLQSGQMGKAVGWGKTADGEPSSELQEINLPYIPYQQCVSAVPEEFKGYVTADKFCAGYLNGSSLCEGDSGGGLGFKLHDLWYLRGIVSVSPVTQNTCDNNYYTAFTNVGRFREWIRAAYIT